MLVEKIDEMIEILSEAKEDAIKLENKHNSAAGTRINKAMKAVKDATKEAKSNVASIREAIKAEKEASKK